MAKASDKTKRGSGPSKKAARSTSASSGRGDGDGAAKGKHLVVVESPAKAKTINRYLGSDYIVKASMGHVRDLPKKDIGVDIENGFAPTYIPAPNRAKILTELRQAARNAPSVFLATDLDREGEAIAWHLAEGLHIPPEKIRRVVFNEITQSAIREAFSHPRDIDMDMVNAQQARRILDRIVGYQVSPLLWRKVATGLSAGRVQSVAVRLIVEREREIESFVPEEYWRIRAIFTTEAPPAAEKLGTEWDAFLARKDAKGNGPTVPQQQEFLAARNAFEAELAQFRGERFRCDTESVALTVARALGVEVVDLQRSEDPNAKGPAQNKVTVVARVRPTGGEKARPDFTVTALKHRESRSRPPGPFTTAALQQAASVSLYYSASRTMRLAQQLYEGVDLPGEGSVGLITYMRTDSRHLSRDSVTAVRELIGKQFGDAYVPEKPNIYSSGERAQEAHEAIRPSDPARTPQSLMGALSDDQWKLYNLIWKRFVACQMPPAVWNVTEADITAATPDGPAVFRAIGRTLKFDGFMRVSGVPKGGDQFLPELQQGQTVSPMRIGPTQHFTQPPPRYTEASLVKAMEAENIGRPSTYASIISTIQDRGYVELQDRAFRPTHIGSVVTDRLVKHFPRVFDVRFTAHMEDELDKVEDAHANWVAVLQEFYGPFKENLDKAAEEMVHAKAETQPSAYTCTECGKPMVYRWSRNGRYLACTGYPECKSTHPVDAKGNKLVPEQVDVACPKCGGTMVKRKGRFGPFLSCTRYPECDGVLNLDKKGYVKLPSAPALEVDLPCPKCGAKLYLRRSKRGPWLSCSKYPKCRGRQAWKELPEEQQAQLEKQLEAHEHAHPTPTVKTLDGAPISETHLPKGPNGSEAQPPDARDEAPQELE